jgi:hypothetical protein
MFIPISVFWALLFVLLTSVYIIDNKYQMLRDVSTLAKRPYSYSRIQLAWWTIIIAASFIAVLFKGAEIPNLYDSTWLLLTISAGTSAAAGVIGISDRTNPNIVQANMSQNQPSQGLLLDILSDNNGVSVHRFQAIVFNLAIGIWFIYTVNHNLMDTKVVSDLVIPKLTNSVLALLGVSSGTYAILKTTENK